MKARIKAAVMTAVVAAFLILISVFVYELWLHGAFLPRWIVWDKGAVSTIPPGVLAKLSDEWIIQDALSFDIDGDDSDESILLVWKRGSYGSRRPTWVEKDETSFSQHIFIYKDYDALSSEQKKHSPYKEGWHPIWMSSALPMKVSYFLEGEEISGTGRRSLDTLSPDDTKIRWGWLDWGLTRVE